MRTPDYWIKREQAWQAQQIKDDTKRMKQIMDKLFEAQEVIQKEIDANWQNFANGQGISISEAMKRADKMEDVYKRQFNWSRNRNSNYPKMAK